jgi:hypothetical protein
LGRVSISISFACLLSARWAMFARSLHARGRNRPNLGVEIDLGPARAEGFAGPGRRQNDGISAAL